MPALLPRFIVGRSGSSAGVSPVWFDAVVVSLPEPLVSGVRRFIVGRSGSSVGAFPVWVFDAVVVSLPEVVVSGVRRFMVGRLGSSEGVDAVLAVEPESVAVVDPDVSEVAVSESRRFIVGRSGSSLVDVLFVFDAVVALGLLWSLVGLVVVSAVGFEPKCGRLGSCVVVMTGRFFDGFRVAVVVFRGAVRGLTLP